MENIKIEGGHMKMSEFFGIIVAKFSKVYFAYSEAGCLNNN